MAEVTRTRSHKNKTKNRLHNPKLVISHNKKSVIFSLKHKCLFLFSFGFIHCDVDYEFMSFKIQFSSRVNQIFGGFTLQLHPCQAPSCPVSFQWFPVGPRNKATHISPSWIQSIMWHFFSSVVLGLGRRGDKSFVRLALERAEGSHRHRRRCRRRCRRRRAAAAAGDGYMFLYMERSLGSTGWVAVSFRWKWQTVSVMTMMRARMKPRMRGRVSSRRSRWSVMHLWAARIKRTQSVW